MNNRLGVLDEHWEAYEVVADGTHRFLWMWHGYNIRVIGVPKAAEESMFYDYAWCYPGEPWLVVERLRAWDLRTQNEPRGWHERLTRNVRWAPDRHLDPAYNQPRCVHGCYISEGCRTINCPGIRE